jgi:peptidyl-prolyl cis-trans isomerase D
VVRWSFNEETEKGTVSNVFDIEGIYVVAMLKNKVEKGIIPLDVIKEQIKPLVIREKKAEYILKKVNDQLAKAKDLNSLLQLFPNTRIDTVDVSFASANIPNYGHEAKATGQIFAAKKSQLTGPVQGEQGVYSFVLTQMNEPPATTDFENQKRQMAMYFQNRAGMLSNILQEKADITDNRLIFY